MDDRLLGLPWATLPRTFHDAFVISKELNLQYIWIDSLCIAQEDDQDWETEAEKMGSIYRNAHITIAAAASNSTNSGFLAQKSPRPTVEIPFQSSKHLNISGHNFASFSGGSGDDEEFVQDVDHSIWNRRGWTFQERLSSHRILFFSGSMIHYECRTLRWAENYDEPLKSSISLSKLFRKGNRWPALHSTWRSLVEEYSMRAFTYEKDKLPTLSSIAQEMHKTLLRAGEFVRYVAGHWNKQLECDLHRKCSRQYDGMKWLSSVSENTAMSYIAPSWS